MKTSKRILAGLMMLMFTMTISITPLQTKAQGWVNAQYFYDNLSPYGNWVYYPGYGNVWVPDAGPGFRPYFSGGDWVFTSYGWMWVSDYSWGWAPFHYGSWSFDPYYGWMWIPGYDWAPAWVSWGYYGGYYGWAPIGPGFGWGHPYYPPIDHWTFVHPHHMHGHGWHDHYYGPHNRQIDIDNNTPITDVNKMNLVNNTAEFNGGKYNAGPSREAFEKESKTKLEPVTVKYNTDPGKDVMTGNEVSIYRPKVNASDKLTAKPAKVVPLENLKPVNGSKTTDVNKGNENSGVKQTVPQPKTDGGQVTKPVNPQQNYNGKQNDMQNNPQQNYNGKPNDMQNNPQPKINGGHSEKQVSPQQGVNKGNTGKPVVTGKEMKSGAKPATKGQPQGGNKKTQGKQTPTGKK